MSVSPRPDNVLTFSARSPLEVKAHDAERKLLGAILKDGSLLSRVRDTLSPEDFGDERHRIIYEAILAVADRRTVQT